ncbi:MAG: PD-(D/E)XK nuclease family transposase [Clostridium sp.]
MGIPKEQVKLDEILKFLFSTSKKVLIKLLNGIFDEKFNEDEVDLTVTNNEFIEETLSIIRGDMFFEINDKNSKIASYHLEFQTRNDKSMVIRMFEYGFRKAKENHKKDNKDKTLKTVYFPKQKVIFLRRIET